MLGLLEVCAVTQDIRVARCKSAPLCQQIANAGKLYFPGTAAVRMVLEPAPFEILYDDTIFGELF
jgi:hypothetical protein